jgi:hypothetical protein
MRYLAATTFALTLLSGCASEREVYELNLRTIRRYVVEESSTGVGKGRVTLNMGGQVNVSQAQGVEDWSGDLTGVVISFYDIANGDSWRELDFNGFQDHDDISYHPESLRIGDYEYSFLRDRSNSFVRGKANEVLAQHTERMIKDLGLELSLGP